MKYCSLRRHNYSDGYTVVELLVVIVVIAVLATLSIVAFDGAQARAQFSVSKSNMESIKKLIEMYYIDNGRYPSSWACVDANDETNYMNTWCGWDQGQGDSFIPGLVPKYASKLPTLDRSRPQADSYLYQSRDSDGVWQSTESYQLIRFKADGLSSAENSSSNPYRITVHGYDGLAWGFKSDPDHDWW